jgi:hypothetical protein
MPPIRIGGHAGYIVLCLYVCEGTMEVVLFLLVGGGWCRERGY